MKTIAVFERDGWRCQICGCDTPRELRGDRRAPNAPQLDHIIPMSKGGGHTWDNVQCACARCNNQKHARILVTPASAVLADDTPF